MAKLLIVEDEAEMAEMLRQAFVELGHSCEVARNGAEGLKRASDSDLLLVDVSMPLMNGFAMVEKLREQNLRVPVIYLTARDSTKDIVRGLGIGANDYVVKPFKFDELVARVDAGLRRANEAKSILTWNGIVLNRFTRVAQRDSRELFLSPTEFQLLELFMLYPETVLSKTSILREVWQAEGYRDLNIVETYVAYLRRKTETGGAQRVIQTVRGGGYVLARAALESSS